MTCILSLSIAREASDISQPARTLLNRFRLRSPRQSGLVADMVLGHCVRECGEAPQTGAFGLEGKSARAAHLDIRLYEVA